MNFPEETLLDAFVFLDRWNLDTLKLTQRRFRPLIDSKLQYVCLRPVAYASMELKRYKTYVVEAAQSDIYGANQRPLGKKSWAPSHAPSATSKKEISAAFSCADNAAQFLFFVIRSSVIDDEVSIRQVSLSPKFHELLAEFGKSICLKGSLSLRHVDSKALPPMELVEGFAQVDALSFRDVTFGSGHQLGDAFLRRCEENGVATILAPNVPCTASDDSILNYCLTGAKTTPSILQHGYNFTTSCEPGENKSLRALRLTGPRVSEEFLRKLVEGARQSQLDTPLVVVLCRLDNFQEQVDWAFVGNPLGALEVEFSEWPQEFPHYTFTFRTSSDRRFKLSWCSTEKSLVLQRNTPRYFWWRFPVEDGAID
ncbi:hypothetical protein AAVH_21937 [Aphelenchoides avenae]|nr:hypothetical protein AAVH_21937 [Aphelenchus avenae]